MAKGREKHPRAARRFVTVARAEGGRVTVELESPSGDASHDRHMADMLFRHVVDQRMKTRAPRAPGAVPASAFDVWAYRDNI